MRFSIKTKSGTIRDSSHGVKTRRGKRVYVDCPGPGVLFLLDDIHRIIVSHSGTPFVYKMESYGMLEQDVRFK